MKKKSILQIDHQRGHYVQIKYAVLVKIQMGFASYLKRQRCEIIKKTLNVEQYIRYIKELLVFLKCRRTNKTVKIPGMSLRLKKVCPVYNTYPITELKNVLANSVASVCI